MYHVMSMYRPQIEIVYQQTVEKWTAVTVPLLQLSVDTLICHFLDI